jgi:hypothetical protein
MSNVSGHGPDSALIEAALDAARVVDDFVRGVLDLDRGRIGGGARADQHVVARVFSSLTAFVQRGVVQGMGAQWAPEQLRKAANEAVDLVTAIDDLAGAAMPPSLDAHSRIVALGTREIPEILRRPDVGSRSPELADVRERLVRTIAVLNETRTKVVLAEMRNTRCQTPGVTHEAQHPVSDTGCY